MDRKPVVLTAEMARSMLILQGPPFDPQLQAIATGKTVCIEADRLARMEAALQRFLAMEDGPVYVVAPDIAEIARAALGDPNA